MIVPGRVTLGVPTLNRSKLVLRAVRSALAQTYAEIEVVVSDDASTDDTLQRLAEIKDPRLIVFPQQKRLGLVGNFDFCLRHATGEFFLLLGSDDALLSAAIEVLIDPFHNPPAPLRAQSIGMTWCPCHIVDGAGTRLWITQPGPPVESPVSLLVELWAGNRGPRQTSMLMRTADAIDVGGFQARHGDLCDTGNWGRVVLPYEHVVCIDRALVEVTNHPGNTTTHSSVRKWQEWARVQHADLVATAKTTSHPGAERRLNSGKRNLLSGVTVSILHQTVGQPGWIRNAWKEAFRSPGLLLTPYVARRLAKDSWKLLRMWRSAGRARSNGVSATNAK